MKRISRKEETLDQRQHIEILYPKLVGGTITPQELVSLNTYFKTGDPELLLGLIRIELNVPEVSEPESLAEREVFSRIYDQIEKLRFNISKPVKEVVSMETASTKDVISTNTSFKVHIPFNVNTPSNVSEKLPPEVSVLSPNFRLRKKAWFGIAATLLLVTGISFIYIQWQKNDTPQELTASKYKNDIPSGKNSATLTLANGRQIKLSDAENGALANEAGVSISKTANGQLIYTVLSTAPGKENTTGSGHPATTPLFNTLSTKNGEAYQIRLPDGTVVWLNAASSLKYPASFAASGSRKVELSGEAYFEVAKDKTHPFVVKSSTQEIEVLGTHFNVNAYSDEPEIKTTLLEGAVKLSKLTKKASPGTEESSIILKPGEQASFKNNTITVSEVNVSAAVDWKNGKFRFKNEPLASILRKVSRWYDVDIVYLGNQQDLPTFSGSVSRFDKVSSVLDMLESTSDVKFSIEGKTIKVK